MSPITGCCAKIPMLLTCVGGGGGGGGGGDGGFLSLIASFWPHIECRFGGGGSCCKGAHVKVGPSGPRDAAPSDALSMVGSSLFKCSPSNCGAPMPAKVLFPLLIPLSDLSLPDDSSMGLCSLPPDDSSIGLCPCDICDTTSPSQPSCILHLYHTCVCMLRKERPEVAG